ncbi:MAG TPA: DUF6655 family protein [Planctomycetaceae bacterium]|nr:DUF6655 family protein [Planctomycetaceae bacterium]
MWTDCLRLASALAACMFVLTGCGKTLLTEGTEQLLASDAVDTSIATIDFSPLAHQKVYFDTTYIQTIKGVGFVNGDYIVSALRQQILAAGCELQAKQEDADIIIEARVGALGGNQHDIVYGVPQSNAVSTVASLLPNAPPIPTIPEISAARKTQFSASAKVAAFAYDRESRTPVWQSGTAVSDSNARNTWLLGVGPFQRGEIYSGTRLAGEKLKWPWQAKINPVKSRKKETFHSQYTFADPAARPADAAGKSADVLNAAHESEEKKAKAENATQPTAAESTPKPASETEATEESKPVQQASWETSQPERKATPAKAPELPLE